ncbi:MAG: aldehyde dehydrogenase family protein, partial [Campylobacterales bacterium]
MAKSPLDFLKLLTKKEEHPVAKRIIGGKEEEGELGNITNPYNNQVYTYYVKCNPEDARRGLKAAAEGFQKIRRTPLSQRIAWLNDVADRLEKERERFAKLITQEVGKPIKESKLEVQRCIENLRICAGEGYNILGETIPTDATLSGIRTHSFYKRVPAGVVVAITPFNFPLNLVAHKVGPALIAGNSVVLKPTPEAPFTAYSFMKLFLESKYAIPEA